MEPEVIEREMLLPSVLPFKRVQSSDKHPKGQSRTKHWKHLKQIIQAENYQDYPPDVPNYMNIESRRPYYPPKKYCDITGFETNLLDGKTKLRFANIEVFKRVRHLPPESVQKYLSLRNAAVVLRYSSDSSSVKKEWIKLMKLLLENRKENHDRSCGAGGASWPSF